MSEKYQLTTRISQEEKNFLVDRAAQFDCSVSQVVRDLINHERTKYNSSLFDKPYLDATEEDSFPKTFHADNESWKELTNILNFKPSRKRIKELANKIFKSRNVFPK